MSRRKRVVPSMRDKYDIIKRLEGDEPAVKLCSEYNIGKSTLSNIKKQKETILQYISKLDSTNGSASRKTMKPALDTDLDDALYRWFTKKRSEGVPVTGHILCEKALELNQELGGLEKFRATSGWLKRFKSRHGILKLPYRESADSSAANVLKLELKNITEECKSFENIHSADETAGNLTALPQEQHCFKHVNLHEIPIVYTSSSDSENENVNVPTTKAFACIDTALRGLKTQNESVQDKIPDKKRVQELADSIRGKHGAILRRHFQFEHKKKFMRVQDNRNKVVITNTDVLKKNVIDLVKVHGRPMSLFDDAAFQNISQLVPRVDTSLINSNKVSELVQGGMHSAANSTSNEEFQETQDSQPSEPEWEDQEHYASRESSVVSERKNTLDSGEAVCSHTDCDGDCLDEFDHFACMLASKIRRVRDSPERETLMHSIHTVLLESYQNLRKQGKSS